MQVIIYDFCFVTFGVSVSVSVLVEYKYNSSKQTDSNRIEC
jgi:hypothetical protein